jgi:hypothetical protein
VDSFFERFARGETSALTDQKFIVYPADFVGTNYTILDADKGKSLVIINGATAVTITIPVALQLKMQVGFIRDGPVK